MSIDAASLQYFQDLIEGRDVVSWHPWWNANRERLEGILGRTEFLKLKFAQVDAAAEMLEKLSIPFAWSAKGRREAVWGRMHRDCVDEYGHPLPQYRKRIYAGAVAAYSAGDEADGARRLQQVVEKIARINDEVERAEALSELQFDAEQLLEEGETTAGLAMLKAVARWDSQGDLDWPAVNFAQQKLRSLGIKW